MGFPETNEDGECGASKRSVLWNENEMIVEAEEASR